jgi:hypothetical protein
VSASRASRGKNRFYGVFWEWFGLEATLGLNDRVDLYAGGRLTGWDEQRDVFRVYQDDYLVVEGEQRHADEGNATSRHDNLSEVVLGLQVQWWQGEGGHAFSTSLQVSSPGFRRKDVTSAGTTDLAATALLTLSLADSLTLHLNAGVVVPLGESWLFENDAEERAGLDRRLPPFPQASVGLTWAPSDWFALGASLEGSALAFRDVELLRGPNLSVNLAARVRWWFLSFEFGTGGGLTQRSAQVYGWVEISVVTPPLWE